ncbi:TIGR03960 family B12-binding radical SAM protein [candidate division KSB1 bacterium]|nr:TIGR03960 family B12-binding radical SAM protein [candidate division KSB1 bacterium]
MSELWDIVEREILPRVQKPGRYIGNEMNVIIKDPRRVTLRIALAFPDVYEIGMSYLGFQILYHILNKEKDLACERVYAPWADMEEKLRKRKIPLFSLETKTPLKRFDLIGFTLQYELHYPDILNMLDLGDIPVWAKDRGEDDPMVIGGGPCAYNPEPMADFFDGFLIGEGESAVLEIVQVLKGVKSKKRDREGTLLALSQIPGVYVPKFYRPKYGSEGKSVGIKPLRPRLGLIQARRAEPLKAENYPDRPVVPLIGAVHDRLSLEIMRGCTRGCRFCNAGFLYRPLRERSVEDLIRQTIATIENTGYEEVSLVSLSTSDYSDLGRLLPGLAETLKGKNVTLSFPSLRPDTFTEEMAGLATGGKKSGLTFAPEAGSQRMRDSINKNNTEEELLSAVTLAFQHGWNGVKLYFMIGLPEETQDDLNAIVGLLVKVTRLGRNFGGDKVHLSISPFVPKPNTPFGWERQDSMAKLREKINYLKEKIRSRKIKLKWRSPELSFIEAVLARGDRKLSKVIYLVWQQGARLEAWSDQFKFDRWQGAFNRSGVDSITYTREIGEKETLPWEHIVKGVTRDFLWQERMRAREGRVTEDCRLGCHCCGLMEGAGKRVIQGKKDWERPRGQIPLAEDRKVRAPQKIRIKFHKKGLMRFIPHLDMVRIIERALRRARIPVATSRGFHPRPRLSFGPPLPLGYTSDNEYLDVLLKEATSVDIIACLNLILPEGLKVLDLEPIDLKTPSLSQTLNYAEYGVILSGLDGGVKEGECPKRINTFLGKTQVWVPKWRKAQDQFNDVRPFVRDITINLKDHTLGLKMVSVDGRSARVEGVLAGLFPDLDPDTFLNFSITRTKFLILKGGQLLDPMDGV